MKTENWLLYFAKPNCVIIITIIIIIIVIVIVVIIIISSSSSSSSTAAAAAAAAVVVVVVAAAAAAAAAAAVVVVVVVVGCCCRKVIMQQSFWARDFLNWLKYEDICLKCRYPWQDSCYGWVESNVESEICPILYITNSGKPESYFSFLSPATYFLSLHALFEVSLCSVATYKLVCFHWRH